MDSAYWAYPSFPERRLTPWTGSQHTEQAATPKVNLTFLIHAYLWTLQGSQNFLCGAPRLTTAPPAYIIQQEHVISEQIKCFGSPHSAAGCVNQRWDGTSELFLLTVARWRKQAAAASFCRVIVTLNNGHFVSPDSKRKWSQRLLKVCMWYPKAL